MVCLLEAIDEKIDIQFQNEIAKADWIPIKDLPHLNFTRMASNICRYLTNHDAITRGQIDLKDLPIGDVFRESMFGFEDYDFMGNNNRLYSSEYMMKLARHLKQPITKL